jgi:histidinol-phosphate/aromatic aminotransferase/cobyric acid decarboxylase-like protein
MAQELSTVSSINIFFIYYFSQYDYFYLSRGWKASKVLHAASKDDWLSSNGPATPSCSQRLLDSCSLVINRLFCPRNPVQADQLVPGSGCSLLLEAVARVVCDAKDIILTPSPIWPIFTTIFAKTEVSLSVISPVVDERFLSAEHALREMESLLDWTEETQLMWEQHFDGLVKDNKLPRAILLSNPQNPLGRCYSRSFLVRVLEFCEKVRKNTMRIKYL